MSTDRQPDADMDHLLRDALKGGAGPAAGPCPDAAELAAYAEHTLTAPEQSAIDAHAAGCARCQETLAILARHEAVAAVPAPARRPWLGGGHLRWLIPAIAASGIVLYLAARPAIAPDVFQTAQAPPAANQAIPEKAPVAETPPPETTLALRSAEGTLRQAPEKLDRKATAPAAADLDRAAPAREKARLAQPGEPGAGAAAANTPTQPPSAPAAVVAEERAEGGAAPVPTQVAKAEVADKRDAAGAPVLASPKPQGAGAFAPAAAPIAADEAPPARALMAGRNEARLEPAGRVIPAALGGTVMWRLDPGGGISRTLDGGDTWNRQYPAAPGLLLAGSASSPVVCWVVGREGTVVVTTDGERWEARSFPVRVDLVAVEAHGARAATVTASDGRRFATSDGGATWTIVP